MDRNLVVWVVVRVCEVALRKESVDRNIIYLLTASGFLMSLSARRAWIEIRFRASLSAVVTVALRKESVDRNPLSPLN